MGENSILKGRHYMQLFILALLFMFAIFTRKSIWIYYVRFYALLLPLSPPRLPASLSLASPLLVGIVCVCVPCLSLVCVCKSLCLISWLGRGREMEGLRE